MFMCLDNLTNHTQLHYFELNILSIGSFQPKSFIIQCILFLIYYLYVLKNIKTEKSHIY